MNADGANALLKTLEEPPASALILLICDSADSLLPTIRSRCQNVRFFPLTESDVAQILVDQQLIDKPEDAKAVAAMSEGSVTLAQQLLNSDLRKLRDVVGREFALFEAMKPLDVSKLIADELDRISSGTEEQRQNAQWLFRFLAEALNLKLRKLMAGDFSEPLLQRYGVRSGADLLAALLDRILVAAQQVESNSPVRLVLDALFDELARMMRLGPVSAR